MGVELYLGGFISESPHNDVSGPVGVARTFPEGGQRHFSRVAKFHFNTSKWKWNFILAPRNQEKSIILLERYRKISN